MNGDERREDLIETSLEKLLCKIFWTVFNTMSFEEPNTKFDSLISIPFNTLMKII